MSQPLRVLVVVRHPVGGIRTYLKYTYGGLDPVEYEFTIVTVRGAERDAFQRDLSAFKPTFHEVSAPRVESKLFWRTLAELRRHRYDLVHSHGLTAGVLTSLANLFSGTPHLVTSHDVFIPEQFERGGWLKRRLIGFLLRRATLVQSVSRGAEDNLLEYLPTLRRERLRVIMNGIPVNGSSPSSSSSFRRTLNVGDVTLFGFLGRFMPQKGFEYVIEAVERLAREPGMTGQFKVVAINDGSYVREYKAQVAAKGLSDQLLFHGFVSDTKDVFSSLDAVLMPSLWEAGGLVAMEAMAAGCPLIATEVHGLGEVLAGSPALRIPPRDAAALAAAMKDLMQNRPAHKERAAAYRAVAEQRFDVRQTSRQLEALFAELTPASRPA